MDDLTFAIVLVVGVYAVARIMNYKAHTLVLKERAEKERARLQRVAELYGRKEPEYPDENL